ncbi:MAG: FtsQ-type POTRA domain-containing protein [Eubacteriales bacterium]|nr:FtsQ-type POTRA domain-containing protein [Eubacteriales bacterium]
MSVAEPKKKKKRRKKHYLLRLLLVILMGVGLYFFLTSEFFNVDKIVVENNKYFTAEQVIGLAEAKPGGNLFGQATEEMKDKLLADPYVKSVSVSRKLPNQLVITVTEREEYATVPYGKSFLVIDKEGMILRQTDTAPTLPLLVGLTLSNIKIGTALRVEENSLLTGTLKLLEKMDENEIYFKKIEISAVVIRAYIYDSLLCEGTPENIMKNMDEIKQVLYDLYKKGTERGVIKVYGDDKDCAFSPVIE